MTKVSAPGALSWISDTRRSAAARRVAGWAACVAGLTLLAACGGGGDAAPPPAPVPAPVPVPIPPPPPPPTPLGIACVEPIAKPGVATVSGRATFESVPNNPITGGLDYSAMTLKPIRGATVDLLDSRGTAVLNCVTDADGAYAFEVRGSAGPVAIRVRAEMRKTSGDGGIWDFSVHDNTRQDALYVLDSPQVTSVLGAVVQRDLRAPSGFDGTSYSGVRAAGPFAILDTVFEATRKVISVSPNQNFPPLNLFWSVNNVPAPGDLSLGQIETSFYARASDGSHQVYLLGQEDGDSDEYDSHVVAHEWGHYFQGAFSRDDSLGGPHGRPPGAPPDLLDMRVAFSEGWGNGWSGVALGAPIYADSAGVRQAQGFTFDVSELPAADERGWYSEAAIQYLVWQFSQQPSIGFGAVFDVMTGPMKSADGFSAIHKFATALKAIAPAATGAVNGLLQAVDISTVNDAWGGSETHDGGIAQALPIYRALSAQPHCVTDAAGLPNKLGNRVFLRFEAQGARRITVESVPGQTGSDPDFYITLADGTFLLAESGVPDAEVGVFTLPAGKHVLELEDDRLLLGDVTGTRCFNITIQ